MNDDRPDDDPEIDDLPPRWLEYMPLDTLQRAHRNPKAHDLDAIDASMTQFDFTAPLQMDERTGRLVAGHGRLEVLERRRDDGSKAPPGIVVDEDDVWQVPVNRGWSSRDDIHAEAYLVTDNKITEVGGWHERELAELLDDIAADSVGLLTATGHTVDDLHRLIADATGNGDGNGGSDSWDDDSDDDSDTGATAPTPDGPRPTLADRFLIAPFDVLDARSGWWQARKKQWLALGIRSEMGRAANTFNTDEMLNDPRFPDKLRTVGGTGYSRDREQGLLMKSADGRDPTYYQQKADAESLLGRELTKVEFEADHYQPSAQYESGTSVFDPVLCELAYRWFTAPDMTVLDPFAGGSVRGLMAALLGRRYVGNDLAAAQIAENHRQADLFAARGLIERDRITWTTGDSRDWVKGLEPDTADLIMTCPPYLWLEKYSDDPADLSAQSEADFESMYRDIIAGAATALRDNRYAVFVVGDVRDPKTGREVDFRGMTIRACEAAGLKLLSAAVLVTQIGSLAVRVSRSFLATRVLGRTHQHVLLFWKGDRSAAATTLGAVDVEMPEGMGAQSGPVEDNTPDLTPIETRGGYLVKRDDRYTIAGQQGGKVRTCWHLATRGNPTGLVTASSRQSPQAMIVAHIAQRLGIPCRLHMPTGADTPEMTVCRAAGAEIIQHTPGYNTVIVARARDDAHTTGYTEIPFGMECDAATAQTATQAVSLRDCGADRIVVPVGSGMSLAGIIRGMIEHDVNIPILGVRVGADPTDRLDTYAPGWRDRVTLVESDLDYHTHAPDVLLGDLHLDPVYEAKCLPFLQPGDLLWVVGIRSSTSKPH